MTCLLRAFYTFLLAWTQFDLAIARSTGRDPQHIGQLVADENKWRAALQDLDIQEMLR